MSIGIATVTFFTLETSDVTSSPGSIVLQSVINFTSTFDHTHQTCQQKTFLFRELFNHGAL